MLIGELSKHFELQGMVMGNGWLHDVPKYPLFQRIFNDILHVILAGTHVFKAFPAYTTTEL